MPVVERIIEYKDAEGTILEGVLCFPRDAENSSKKLPGVLVFHAFRGCLPFEIGKARELAQSGYVAFAADVYGKGVRTQKKEEGFALMTKALENRNSTLRARIKASIDTIAEQKFVDAEKIAAIGFCFGGLVAIDAARWGFGIAAAVSFHGTLKVLENVDKSHFKATIQVHHGDADPHINPQVADFQAEMRERGVDWVFINYGGVEHSFTDPDASAVSIPGLAYSETATRRAWASMRALFDEKFNS